MRNSGHMIIVMGAVTACFLISNGHLALGIALGTIQTIAGLARIFGSR